MIGEIIPMAQGPAVLADEDDLYDDELGITRPYLHRRMETEPQQIESELAPRKYGIAVWGVDSYRTIETSEYEDEINPLEIP